MANNIKGLTIEIGGDTTKLGKALEDVNKRSRDLSSELGDINRLLKMDPGNTDLLVQKQKVLAEAIENTGEKLKKLKEAEKQVQEQFERGEVSEEQYRALQREIIATEKKMDSYAKAAEETEDALRGLGDETEKTEKSSGKLGETLANAAKVGLKAVAAAATAVVTGLIAAAESTREYRTEMGKLDTAFTQNGHTSEAATKTYKALQGVLGETEQAVEASNHLAKLCDNEEELATWTDIATGVYATFGASLPIEGLTEAANETAKTGALTGSLADALNWAGVSEDDFQAKLDECTTEQERQALITETLNGLYKESAEAYKETNAEVIRANEANEAWTSSLAGVGGAIEPIITDVKMMGASLLSELVPGVEQLAESFRGLLNGDAGAAAGVGEALSGIITQLLDKILELAPSLVQAGIGLLTSLTTSLLSMLPSLVSTGVELLMALLNGLTSAIPLVTQALVDMIPQLVSSLSTGIPLLIDGALQLFLSILQAIPLLLPPLIAAIPTIVMSVINGLLSAIPALIEGALQFLLAICDAIPLLVSALIPLIPEITTSIILALLDATPLLLDAAVELLLAIVEAIPLIIVELVRALPQIWETMKSYLGQLPGKIWAILTSVIQNFVKWATQSRAKALEGAKNVLLAVVDTIKQLPGKIWSFLVDIVTKVGTWGSNMVTKAKEGMSKVVTSVTTTLKELPSKVLSIGKDLVSGLWNGINDKLTWLKNKISGFASSVLDGIKSFFGVNSPSRETAWIGDMLDQGLAEGMLDNATDPIKAAQKVSGSVLDAATADLNGLKLERSLQHTFTGPAASAAPGADALLAKLDGIYERLGRLQIVMDSGALVGETIDKIDSALGTRQLLRARRV